MKEVYGYFCSQHLQAVALYKVVLISYLIFPRVLSSVYFLPSLSEPR